MYTSVEQNIFDEKNNFLEHHYNEQTNNFVYKYIHLQPYRNRK